MVKKQNKQLHVESERTRTCLHFEYPNYGSSKSCMICPNHGLGFSKYKTK